MNTLPYELMIPCGIIVAGAYEMLGKPEFYDTEQRSLCRVECDRYIVANSPAARNLKTPVAQAAWIKTATTAIEAIILDNI